MEVSATNVTAQSAAQRAAEQKSTGKNSLGGDFETFLSLLTAQMRNQDPLNPVDSTEFVAQLANFSSVEQQVKANDTLADILQSLSGGGAESVNWIGKQVESTALTRFAGDPIAVNFPPGDKDQSATLIVLDESGKEIARQPADPAAATVLWSGKIADGTAPTGLYSFVQERSGEDGLPKQIAGGVFNAVTEVRFSSAGTNLILETGETIKESDVTSIKASN